MAPAPVSAPVEEGGLLTHRVDDGEVVRTRGDSAEITVADDGDHTVTYSATDAAGNESPEQVAHVRVDQTAPELVVFEDQQPADPRRLVVAASDRTSGVVGGRIELRPVAGGDWRQLDTTFDRGRLTALVDDEALPTGIYELRATVADAAGNQATGDRRRDGTYARIDTASLRAETSLAAAFEATTAKKKKCRRTKGKKRCSVSAAKPVRTRTLKVAYGKAGLVRGTLTVGTVPLPDSVVDIYSKSKATGSDFSPIGAVRTDPAGNFVYKAPAGAGRVLRFRYAGSALHRPAVDELTLQVTAASTLRVNRRRARNGQPVTFTGQLKTRPIAGRRKALNLQAFYRRRWRTFATPRADKKGRWTYRYRFGATHGRVVYRFRVVVPGGSDYPYEKGTSKAVTVTVKG
jgi:hypothetical protein